MIHITNLDEFCRGLIAAVDAIEADWSAKYRYWVMELFQEILEGSPQWSGNFAANWNVSKGAFSSAYAPFNEGEKDARFRGHYDAVFQAQARSKATLDSLTLRDQVFINNLTPYGVNVARNELEYTKMPFLRAGNYIDPRPYPLGNAMQQATNLFVSRFGR